MESKPAPALNKRRFWLCLALVFFCGILCGGVIAICGVRYARAHFAPPLERVSRKITARIARDFSLDEATRNTVEKEVLTLGTEIGGHMIETRTSIEMSIERRRESISALMPDAEKKERWLKEYRNYFPKLPPIPTRDDSGR